MYDTIIAHYSEIALKGLNRPFFERKLIENLKRVLKDQSIGPIRRIGGGITIQLQEDSDLSKITEALSELFGIASFTPAYVADQNPESIDRLVLEKVEDFVKPDLTFRIRAKRADKNLPYTSIDLNRRLGSKISERFGIRAEMENPKLTIYVELAAGRSYIYFSKQNGARGLPVGTNGRLLVLLSGGIDSPVASWMLSRRGCIVDHLHFHPFKDLSGVEEKIVPLVSKLARYTLTSTLYCIPFYPFQIASLKTPQRQALLLFRRYMLNVAEELAERCGAKAVATGESLGQVASQTLENIRAVEDALSIPVLRPLLTYDKEQIIDTAKKIDTYTISITPYKDCCASLVAKHPETKGDAALLRRLEGEMRVEDLVEESLKLTEAYRFTRIGERVEVRRLSSIESSEFKDDSQTLNLNLA